MRDVRANLRSVSDAPPSDPTAARDLAGALFPDETLLWAGRPDERRYTRTDGRLIALGAFWTVVAGAAFVGFALTFFSDEYAGIAFSVRVLLLALAALPFAAVSVFCLGGHVALRHTLRRRIAYAVTTRRVLVRRPATPFGGPPVLRALPRDGLAEPVVEAEFRDAGTARAPTRAPA